MKIVLVNTHLDPRTGGGYAHRTFELARAMRKIGHEVLLAATDFKFEQEAVAETKGFRTILFRTLWSRFFVPEPNREQMAMALENTSLVHLMGFWSMLNVWFAHEAKSRGIPYVVCPAGALPPIGRSRVLKSVFHLIFGKRMLRGAVRVIAVTPKEAAELRDFGVEPEKIDVIPNGVPEHFFAQTDAHRFRQKVSLGDSPYVLFVGRLNPIKGPDLLLDAYLSSGAADQGVHLVVAGPDEGLKESLVKQAHAAKVQDKVHFPGFINLEEKQQGYAGSLVLAVPSRSEAMSLVALEAAAMGRPVLMTDCCGFDEVAEIGGGIVVPITSDAIAKGLTQLMTKPRAELDAMGARLRSHVQNKYVWPQLAAALIENFLKSR